MIRSTFRWVIGFSFASLALAAEGAAVPDAVLLDRIGLRVKQVWDDFSTVTCTENLTQEKFNEKGKVVLASRANFDYLIALRWNGNDLLVDESRLEVGPPRKKRPEGALLATRGFATMLLILHPDFQSSFYLTSLPDDVFPPAGIHLNDNVTERESLKTGLFNRENIFSHRKLGKDVVAIGICGGLPNIIRRHILNRDGGVGNLCA